MNATRSRALGISAIATALVILLVLSVLCYQDWRHYGLANQQIQQSRRVLSLNQSLLDRMRDPETGQRGFLLTGQTEYLAPYEDAVRRLPADIQELAGLVNSDSDQRLRFLTLEARISEKMAELKRTIDLRQSGQADAALALVQTNQGKELMDRIRATSREVEDAENTRWTSAWSNLSQGAQSLRLLTLAGAALLVVLVGIGGGALKIASGQMEALNSELRNSKQAAEQSRDLLRATLYSIGDGVVTTDSNGVVEIMNAAGERLTGYSEAEARGLAIERVFPIVNQASRNQVENPVRSVLRNGRVVGLANHTVLISKGGTEIPIDDTAAPIRGPAGALSGAVLVFRDVSERRKAAEVSRRLAEIVENSDDAIVGKSLDGIITNWNRGAERLFGYSAEEMIGTPISRLIPPDRVDDMHLILAQIAKGESVDHYETERITKDGRRIRVSLSVSPIRDEEGHVVGASKIARDITRQKQLEELLRQTQKMEAVGRLAGGIAHDFNNLLTVILGYATTLKNRLPPQDPLHNTVAEILRSGEQAASLTAQLLTFSRRQVIQPKILDLNSSIAESSDMLRRLIGEDVDLFIGLAPEPCRIKADTGQLTQILINLAANARDAMPAGGKLTIETHAVVREREDLGRRGTRPAGRYALLAVTDTGTGMDAETTAHLFEPFFTTKESGKGTGLGLATVYGIVTQHGGWIDVYSEPNHGATFKIYFPLSEEQPIESPEPPKKSAVHKGTILLVEDQAAIRLLAEDVLAEAGHRVLAATNGRAALELLAATNPQIDLLITDVVMPEMSGPALAEHLTRTRPEITVLYISGYTDHALLHRGTLEKGTAFLQKPFLPEVLIATVNE